MPDQIAKLKSVFFDKSAVTDALDPGVAKALGKTGARIRLRARGSLKYAKGPSRPGQPPHVHRSVGFVRKRKVKGKSVAQASSPFRELLLFSYDPSTKSVVIGPAIGGPRDNAPEVLEFGGTCTVERDDGRRATIRVGARPTMQPALDKEQAAAAKQFGNLF